MSMVHKDMHHMLLDLIRKEDPVKIYLAIQEHMMHVFVDHGHHQRKSDDGFIVILLAVIRGDDDV